MRGTSTQLTQGNISKKADCWCGLLWVFGVVLFVLVVVRWYVPLLATAMGGGQTYRLRDDKEAEGELLGMACLVWQCVRLSIRLGVKRTGREGRGFGGEGTGVATLVIAVD